MTTAARRPPNAGKGRKKGTPNKLTAEVKDMIRQALEQAGGVDYLVKRAKDPRTATAFLSLVGRIVPLTLQGDKSAPVTITLSATDLQL